MVTSPQQLLADAQIRLAELLRASPAADLERNLKALLAQTFQKLELVTREEFEVERERLARLQIRLEALERELQSRAPAHPSPAEPVTQHTSAGEASAAGTPPIPAHPYQMPPQAAR